MISKAYSLSEDLKKYRMSQESYEREKAYFIEVGNNMPITIVSHSGIPEEEQRKRILELVKQELESMNREKTREERANILINGTIRYDENDNVINFPVD